MYLLYYFNRAISYNKYNSTRQDLFYLLSDYLTIRPKEGVLGVELYDIIIESEMKWWIGCMKNEGGYDFIEVKRTITTTIVGHTHKSL